MEGDRVLPPPWLAVLSGEDVTASTPLLLGLIVPPPPLPSAVPVGRRPVEVGEVDTLPVPPPLPPAPAILVGEPPPAGDVVGNPGVGVKSVEGVTPPPTAPGEEVRREVGVPFPPPMEVTVARAGVGVGKGRDGEGEGEVDPLPPPSPPMAAKLVALLQDEGERRDEGEPGVKGVAVGNKGE